MKTRLAGRSVLRPAGRTPGICPRSSRPFPDPDQETVRKDAHMDPLRRLKAPLRTQPMPTQITESPVRLVRWPCSPSRRFGGSIRAATLGVFTLAAIVAPARQASAQPDTQAPHCEWTEAEQGLTFTFSASEVVANNRKITLEQVRVVDPKAPRRVTWRIALRLNDAPLLTLTTQSDPQRRRAIVEYGAALRAMSRVRDGPEDRLVPDHTPWFVDGPAYVSISTCATSRAENIFRSSRSEQPLRTVVAVPSDCATPLPAV